MSRKRNVSDGDSGFDSSLSSRSSSISLEESQQEYVKLFDHHHHQEEIVKKLNPLEVLREEFANVITADESIEEDYREEEGLFVITNKATGFETLFKPPTRLRWSPEKPTVCQTYSGGEYERCTLLPRSQLFHSRLEWELEKQLDKLDILEVDLVMDTRSSPPPSLGIRVIGVNMIHGVQDKLNIYVKRVVEDSVAGVDGRIQVNDHIVSVNGISLVGVSQKLAAQTLSNCAICPDTSTVHFVLGRPPKEVGQEPLVHTNGKLEESSMKTDYLEPKSDDTIVEDNQPKFAGNLSGDKMFTKPKNAFPKTSDTSKFEGRDAIRLIEERVGNVKDTVRQAKEITLAASLAILATLWAVKAEPNQ